MIVMEQIKDVKWYTGPFQGCIGIVLVDTGYGHKAYIGIGRGFDEKEDQLRIAQNGGKFWDGPKLWPEIKDFTW